MKLSHPSTRFQSALLGLLALALAGAAAGAEDAEPLTGRQIMDLVVCQNSADLYAALR